MSVVTFLRNMWRGLKHIFSSVEDYVKENIHAAVMVVENIKAFIDNPAIDFITAVIPGDIDDSIKRRLREWLPKVLLSLQIIQDCAELEDPERLRCIVQKVAEATDDQRDLIYHNIAVLLLKYTSDGEFSISDGIGLIEWYYRNKVKK
jgi:hypothetical protein